MEVIGSRSFVFDSFDRCARPCTVFEKQQQKKEHPGPFYRCRNESSNLDISFFSTVVTTSKLYFRGAPL